MTRLGLSTFQLCFLVESHTVYRVYTAPESEGIFPCRKYKVQLLPLTLELIPGHALECRTP